MNRILKGYIEDYTSQYGLNNLRESELFEYFSTYTILRKLDVTDFEIDDLVIGGTNDMGIDSISILINGHPVNSTDEIDFFINQFKIIDVKFVFVQSKTSEKFEGKSMSDFAFGVSEFFSEEESIIMNDEVSEKKELQKYLYGKSAKMNQAPSIDLYYVTSGTWIEDRNLTGRVKRIRDDFKKTRLFSSIEFIPVDADLLMRYYREIRNRIEKEINFERVTPLPKINKINESYIGILPCKEYLSLITDEDGHLLSSLFYDNVRDFQGYNPVNKEISETIDDTESQNLFALLNNGVTIVSKSINRVGDTFKISDFQVVNGCQTSHILFRKKDKVSEEMHLPIKLIVSDDMEVINQVIVATNRQTEVKVEAFASLSDFHRNLEEFYNSYSKEEGKLYYERRSKQYDSLPIQNNKVISLSAQIKSFISMFLNEPHSTHRYYGELLNAYDKSMFKTNHKYIPYYASSLGLHVIDSMFSKREFPLFFKKFRYHILMLIKYEIVGNNIPRLNSNAIENESEKIIHTILNEAEIKNIIEKNIETIQSCLNKVDYSPFEATRRRHFTEKILEADGQNSLGETRENGTVDWYNKERGYGVIKGKTGQEYFVHYSSIQMKGYKSLDKNDQVSFIPIKSNKRMEATKVTKAS